MTDNIEDIDQLAAGYQVWCKDGFDDEAEPFQLTDLPEYPGYQAALDSAKAELDKIDAAQPHAGGDNGIADRIYIRHPDGHLDRVYRLR